MALQEELEVAGNWLFRWRSYLPLVLLVPMLMALGQFTCSAHDAAWREVWELLCLLVSMTGAGLRILTVGFVPARTSGRNTHGQQAEALNTTGSYSIVRHPLYLANFLIWLGIALFLGVWWFVFLFVTLFWLYYERIMYAEEQFLRRQFGQLFVDWSNRVPAFIPNPLKWQRPAMPFSVKTVLKRECATIFAIAIGFPAFDLVEDTCLFGSLHVAHFFIVLACAGTAVYLLLRALKKRTRLLDVEGR